MKKQFPIIDGTPKPWQVTPLDADELKLAAQIDSAEVDRSEPQYAYLEIESCDFCGCTLAKRGLFVDGSLRGQLMWANMCAQCFAQNGAGIGWGTGQLYALQPDGEWRLVSGFCPPSLNTNPDASHQNNGASVV